MSFVSQLVQLALSTVQGSSAIASLGQTISQIQEQSPNFAAQVDKAARTALADLETRHLVQVIAVTLDTLPSNPDGGRVTIQWRDLTTNSVIFTRV